MTVASSSLASPRPRRGTLKYVLGLLAILAASAYMAYGGLSRNLVFFVTPSEVLQDEARYRGRTLRLGGLVQPGTVRFDRRTLDLRFTVTDGTASFPVVHRGTPPDLFQEGLGVTVEGRLDGGVFRGETLLVKHSEEYRAPKPGEEAGRAFRERLRAPDAP